MGASIIILTACAVIMGITLILVTQMKRKNAMGMLLHQVLPKNYHQVKK